MTATLSTHEEETEASPLSKQDDALFPGPAASGKSEANGVRGGEVLINAAVTGADNVAAPTPQAGAMVAPDSTAARQVVQVETLLQNALSVAQGIRPNGSSHLEMRVRLDGGAQDVTVRMQVTNDRMQVTFQTDSPEMRKALEHGWQQFSADASSQSTLALSQPLFEGASSGTGTPGGQTDTPAFSSDQRNPRGQDAASMSAEETAPPAVSRQAGFTTTATVAGSASAERGWRGWA